jgi:molybdenum cofactor cytidylyltransferase
MKLSTAFRLSEIPCLALVGAGGKSSALFCLGRELAETYPTVILSTTTHLGSWQVELGHLHRVVNPGESIESLRENQKGLIFITGKPDDTHRISGLDSTQMDQLYRLSKKRRLPLIIEADGARRLPLKAPGDHEPVIPQFVDNVVVCAGLSGLGKPLTDIWVHRPKQFALLSGMELGDQVTPEALSRVLAHPMGGLKNIPAEGRRILLLNQADTIERLSQAGLIARLVQHTFHCVVIANLPRLPEDESHHTTITSFIPEIFAVHTPIAGIILAAGGAQRYGSSKQIVEWNGQPLVRHVAMKALVAGLSPVIVVTGAEAEPVSQAVAGLPLQLVNNPNWQKGQSSSLQAGLKNLPADSAGAIFLLADQPNIPVTLIEALIEAHSQTLAPVVAPLVDGQRGNPVLFNQVTFADLMSLTGDQGGRQLFKKYPLSYVPWHDREVLDDIDTLEDYVRLTQGGRVGSE